MADQRVELTPAQITLVLLERAQLQFNELDAANVAREWLRSQIEPPPPAGETKSAKKVTK